MTRVRPLTAGEVETLVAWAAAEGWNPGIGDAPAFRIADPSGFLGAFASDQLAAGISVVRYGGDFGFLGLYICQPKFRGQGFGRAVWQAGLAHLGARTIGLDGVPDLQPYYASVGFEKAHDTLRLVGRPQLDPPPSRTARAVPLDAALALDRACFPARRTDFLANWLRRPRLVRAVFADGDLKGYGVARACATGHKIGPLFAESEATALQVIAALSAAVTGEIVIDVPEPQQGFIAALDAAGMRAGFATARMYRGPAPKIDTDRVFGLTTLELG